MSEYLIQDTTLTGIADKIRPLLGLTGTMTPEQMQTNLTTEQANVAAALAALAEKGVGVPEGANSNALAGLIASIEAGGNGFFCTDIIPETDIASYGTTTLAVEHTLGATPNFAIVVWNNYNYAEIPANSLVISGMIPVLKDGAVTKGVIYGAIKTTKSGSFSNTYMTAYSGFTIPSNLNAYSNAGPISFCTDKTVTICSYGQNSTVKMFAGSPYRVILGVL